MSSGRSNSPTLGLQKNNSMKTIKSRLKLNVTDEMILKRNDELRKISNFVLNDLFRNIVSGPVFNNYLANVIFTAPSGSGLKHIGQR